MVKKRSIVFAVIFSFVTFGLYGLYWIYKVTNEMNTLLYKKDAMDSVSDRVYSGLRSGGSCAGPGCHQYVSGRTGGVKEERSVVYKLQATETACGRWEKKIRQT